MNATTTDPQSPENASTKSSFGSQNRMIRRIGIVVAVLFLIISTLVFLFASVAPGYMGADLQRQLKGHPGIVAELGELESCTMSYSATLANGNPDVIVFEVVGSKDKGQLIVDKVTTASPAFDLESIIIRKYDGREIPLSNAPPKLGTPESAPESATAAP
jgi:hypothetical protein